MGSQTMRELKARIKVHEGKLRRAEALARGGSQKALATAAYHAEQIEVLMALLLKKAGVK